MDGREHEKRPHCDRVPLAGDDDGRREGHHPPRQARAPLRPSRASAPARSRHRSGEHPRLHPPSRRARTAPRSRQASPATGRSPCRRPW
jgi:hypothetical protein